MTEWVMVISLIAAGLTLLVVEIFFVPGTTIVGVLGFLFLAAGVGLSFRFFGNTVGWSMAGGTAVTTGLVLYFSFKANVWGRFSLKATNTGKVNEGELNEVAAGVEGVTISALRPSGKAEMNNKMYEVRTSGNYVEAGTKVRVTQIVSNQIIVEPLLLN